ncbi:Taurine-binding periplasmic protein precursor [compost metagenome]
MKGNTYLDAKAQSAELGSLVNQTIIDTARFLESQGKVPGAASDYRQFVTDRFVKAVAQ